MKTRLMRTSNDRVIGGVCGGLARYFGVDPVFVRLAFVLFLLPKGFGAIVYLILLLLMPLDSEINKAR